VRGFIFGKGKRSGRWQPERMAGMVSPDPPIQKGGVAMPTGRGIPTRIWFVMWKGRSGHASVDSGAKNRAAESATNGGADGVTRVIGRMPPC